MKRSELLFNLISIVVDLVMIIVAGVTAFYLRFQLSEFRPVLYSLTIVDYVKVLVLIAPILLLLMALAGLYNLKGTRRISSELLKIVLAISSGLLLVVILFFFNQSVFPSRLIILFTWVLTIALISLGRIILRQVQVNMLRRGIGQHRLVIIQPQEVLELISDIDRRKELGYRIVAKIDSNLSKEQILEELNRIKN